MSRARDRRRQRRFRKRGEQLELEQAFVAAWWQQAWAPRPHETPLGLCFPSAAEWRTWLGRAHERYLGPMAASLAAHALRPSVRSAPHTAGSVNAQ